SVDATVIAAPVGASAPALTLTAVTIPAAGAMRLPRAAAFFRSVYFAWAAFPAFCALSSDERVWRSAVVVVAASYASWACRRWSWALVQSFLAATRSAARVVFAAVARTSPFLTTSPTFALTVVVVHVPSWVAVVDAVSVVGINPNARLHVVADVMEPVAATSSVTSVTAAVPVR